MGKPKIIIAFCTWCDIKPNTMFNLLQLTAFEPIVQIIGTVATLLPHARFQVIKDILDRGRDFTHILFIDTDMSAVHPDVINGLLSANKDIISPTMTFRTPPFRPALGFLDPVEEQEKLFWSQFKKPQPERMVMEVAYTGTACTLIKREVFEEVPAPWFHMDRKPRPTINREIGDLIAQLTEKYRGKPVSIEKVVNKAVKLGLFARDHVNVQGEDINFCSDARRYGKNSYVHTGFYTDHLGETRFNINDTVAFLQDPKLLSRLEQLTYVWRREVPIGPK